MPNFGSGITIGAGFLRSFRNMRDRIIGLLCAALLGALTFFYVDQILRAPDCSRESSGHGCRKIGKAHTTANVVAENPDDRLADYTLWLAVATFALVAVSGLQIRFLINADKTARISAIAARKTAIATGRVATATILQATTNADIVSKKERPWLFIFGVRYFKKSEAPFDSLFIDFTVGNYGVMPSIIDNAYIDIVVDSTNPPYPRRAYDEHPLLGQVIAPGGTLSNLGFNIPSNIPFASGDGGVIVTSDGDVHPIPNFNIDQRNTVFFRVIIEYHGPFSAKHETAACWMYSTLFSQFVSWGDVKYNYTI